MGRIGIASVFIKDGAQQGLIAPLRNCDGQRIMRDMRTRGAHIVDPALAQPVLIEVEELLKRCRAGFRRADVKDQHVRASSA